jgi:MSHA biogenesis protein MshL
MMKAHTAAVLLVLTGCASQMAPPGATYDRISEEVKQAVRAPAKPSRPEAVDRALLPPLQAEPIKPAPMPEPRFDLSVANAPAQQVFLAIVSGTRYSMLVHPDVTGSITVNLKNVTVREALDTLRDLYGYEYRVQGTRVFIQPNTLQSRIFQVNYLASKRQGTSDMRVTSGSISSLQNPNGALTAAGSNTSNPAGSGGTSTTTTALQSSRLTTSSDNDFWGELTSALRAVVGTEGGRQVIVNPLAGMIVVRGFPTDIRNVENYLRTTQLIIERQVMLEAKILEVQLSDGFSSGVNWAAFGKHVSAGPSSPGTVLQNSGPLSNPNLTATAGSSLITDSANLGSMFGLAFQSQSFAALLQFLETQGNVQVISSPRIATINNQQAVLKVGTDEFFVTGVTTNTATLGTSIVTSPTITVQPFFSGVALDVTPQIDESDTVILHLHPSVSVVAEKQKTVNLGTLGNFQLPLAASTVNETDSIVRVQDGNIVAIGGLMKQQQSSDSSGLPGASSAPVVGTLFGQKNRSSTKSELVILLKPTIIRGSDSWQQDALETQDRLKSYDPRVVQNSRGGAEQR